MVWLLDVNVMVALTWPSHVHHDRAHAWFVAVPQRHWATCALTQLGFVRISSNPTLTQGAASVSAALDALSSMVSADGHVFWPDAPAPLEFGAFSDGTLTGHRQVTDAYLSSLATAKGGRLATLDRGLARWAASADLAVDLVE